MSTARLAETHAPSVLPSPEPEPERASPEPERASPEPESASPPISLCSPPLTTVSFTEPDCSMLSISQGPPPPPPSIEHLDELQSSIILVLPGSPPPPTEPLDDLQSPMQSVSPGLQPQSTPYLHVPRQPTPPISSGSLPQPTVPFAEPERSTLSKSPGPSPRPTEQQHEDMAPNVPDYVLDLKLGPMPKPPAPADRMYCESAAKDILRENPGMHSIEAVRLAHIRWNSLSEEDRQPFKDRFDALAIQFKVDIDTYNVRKEAFLSTYSESLSTMRIADPEPSTASLSPGPPHWLTEQQYQDAEPNIDEVLERELGPRPKPSAPADRMYCESATKDILRENPGMHSIEAVRLAHIRWNSLSEEDRQTLKGRCDALNKQYNIDIVAYDARKEAFLSTYSEPVSTAYPNVADEVSRQELGLMPKRPPSAIRLYIRRVTGDIRRENPGMGFETIDKLAATRWKNLSEAGRRPFLDHHHALKRRYKAGIAAHNAYKEAFLSTHGESVPKTPVADHEPSTSSLLPGPSIQPTVSGAEPEPSTSSLSRGHPPKLRKQQNKDDVLDRELGPKPIRPQHAVRLYSNSVIGDIRRENPGMKCAEIHSVASSRWRNLSEEDRRPFEDCYHELKRKYDAEIAAYNARKQAFLSTHGESVSTTPIADPEPSTSSLSPGPPIQPTVSGAEPEPSTSSLSRGPPPQSTKQQNMDDVLDRELGPKPIRPQPAVRLYFRSIVDDVRRENPGMKGAESFPVASIRWKNLSKEDRRPFEDRYYELKMKYNTNIAAYNARKEAFLSTYGESVSTTPIADRELSTSSLSPGLPHRLTGKRHQGAEPNAADDVLERVLGPRPKPPAPADRMYCESATKDILRENPGMHSIEAVRLAHIRWNSLSEEDRQTLKDRCDALSKQYQIDIVAYDARKEAFLSTHGESVSTAYPNVADEVSRQEFGLMPKRPPPAIRLYIRRVAGDIRRENPGMGFKTIEMLATTRWKNLSEAGRRPFVDHHHALKRRYKAGIAAYNAYKEAFLSAHGESVPKTPIADPEPSTSSLSPGPPIQPTVSGAGPEPEPSTLSKSRGHPPKLRKQQNKDDVLERELGQKPSRPQYAVRLYSNSVIGDIRRENPGMHYAEILSVASIRWRNLSEEDRRPFEDRHYELKRRYNADITAYNARKEAFLSTHGESVSTTPIADPEPSTSSLSPGPPIQPTVPGAEPKRSTLSKSRGHPPKLRKQQNKDDVLDRELGPKPIRPQHAVRLYYNSVIGDIRRENPGMKCAEILSVAATRWRNLSEEDRRPFEDRYYELKR
ncbi:hypothetical protein GGH92_003502, partial [Coemansia sp. RSA 2673]